MFLKKFTPRSLYNRFLLIVVVPMLLVIVIATYMFYERHWKSINRNLSSNLIGEIALIVRDFEHAAPDQRPFIIKTAKEYLGFEVSFKQGISLPVEGYENVESYEAIRKGLQAFFKNPSLVMRLDDAHFLVFVQFEQGLTVDRGVLSIKISDKRLENPTTYIFIMWIIGAAVILMLISVVFLRNQVRSIIRLAIAAERFGKGQDTPSFRPQGAKEIRRAGIAFIEMRERIKRLIERRTQMLAGVSHDLRTPLTRMRLQVAMMRDEVAAKELYEDIIEMEKMLDGYLSYIKAESSGISAEHAEKVNLKNFINNIIEGFKNFKGTKEAGITEDISITLRPDSFKRALVNFIDNALRYGSHVRVSAFSGEGYVEIDVEDNGPGIPEDKREEVFQPFYRLEASRNKETGGIGLGMSIARDIVYSHGGDIKLDKSSLGGLKVKIILPV